MKLKTIRVTAKIHRRLAELKTHRESFSVVIERLLPAKTTRALIEQLRRIVPAKPIYIGPPKRQRPKPRR